ncbi:MAG TPA: IPT/TIG domain-containing protein [Solirubrobacteraceae bacterium]|nr:IPT/TIG domain-containing protein [Solirubrobacteraceae bacterium]
MVVAAALALATLALAPVAFAARVPARRACRGSSAPSHARCLAMRLLVEPQGAQPAAAARPQRPAAVTAAKPFPGFLTPERLHAAYALPNETAAGSTQTIAIVDAFNDPSAEADLGVYDKTFGLPACTAENGCFRKVNENGEASPLPPTEGEWASEISIDVQMAHSTCQSCHILLVEAQTEEFSDLAQGVDSAAKLGASEISNSYGGTEEPSLSKLESSYNHPGVAVTVSSGDCGYIDKACPEELSVGTEFPAGSPHVVAVGGTSLKESGGVWTSTAWSGGGSGCSQLFTAQLWESSVANYSATGCDSARGVADVAAIGDPETGVDVFDSTPEFPGAATGWGVWGGTSVASPIVAGEFGLAGGAQDVAYPAATLYAHAGEPSALYDVTSGSNGECAGATICTAVPGFDGPTGLGSPLGLRAFAVAGTPTSATRPAIKGYPEQGLTLEAVAGTWTGSPSSESLQWERCAVGCQPIAGATGPTYTATSEDVGHQIRLREGAFNTTGSSYEDSAAVGPVASDVPSVSGFSPSSAITGSTMIVTGSALDSTSQVKVGALDAAFAVVSPTELEVTVPDGASKGKVLVTTAHGSATTKSKFTATFSITSFAPQPAAAGSKVTIKGIGFTPSSTVSFDGTPAAAVSYLSPKKLKAVVPGGIGTGPITVTNTVSPAGTVSSPGSFTP